MNSNELKQKIIRDLLTPEIPNPAIDENDNQYDLYWTESKTNKIKDTKTSIPGLNMLTHYLYASGGPGQQSRLIKDKRRSLDRAIEYSYQGAIIKKYYPPNVELMIENQPVKALINPNKLKQDYDDKILSVGFEADLQPGDVFEWCQTGTYWLIYLQDLTELAYFRGDIRKCSLSIDWIDEEGNQQSTYAAIRGPVETKINYIQKHQISVDTPNYSLSILMPLTDATFNYFKRYSKFYLQNSKEKNICWRVEATDSISTPGILEVVAVEYYANETEDDMDNGLVGALKVEPIDPNAGKITGIIGDTFIKPQQECTFICAKQNGAKWSVPSKCPIEKINGYTNDKGRSVIVLKWTASYSGQFELAYGDQKKTIVVESLF